jgi:hypothetical protein
VGRRLPMSLRRFDRGLRDDFRTVPECSDRLLARD